MKHVIGNTRNKVSVYVDLIRSEAAGHISKQPYLLVLVKEALTGITLRGTDATIEHDMGRIVGYDFVVDASGEDSIFYAQLLHDDVYTRFLKNGKPTQTQRLSLRLRRGTEGDYELLDIWVGQQYPPRPGSTEETAESTPFWAAHAVVLDKQTIQSRTLTKIRPYNVEPVEA